MDRRDGRSLASILRADSRWVIPGRGPLCGTYVGPEQIFDMWRKTAEYTGGGLTLSLIDVLANDERAVALVQVRGRGESGRSTLASSPCSRSPAAPSPRRGSSTRTRTRTRTSGAEGSPASPLRAAATFERAATMWLAKLGAQVAAGARANPAPIATKAPIAPT